MTPIMASYVDTYFKTQMASNYPSVPIQFENNTQPTTSGTYVETYYISGSPIKMSVGTSTGTKYPGIYQVNVFTTLNIGSGEGSDLAFDIGQFFQYKRFVTSEGILLFREAGIYPRGELRGKHKVEMRVGYVYNVGC